MDAFRPNQAAFRSEAAVLNDRRYFAERPELIVLLEELRRARTPQQFFDLHLRLFQRFSARQRAVDKLRATLKEQQQRKRDAVTCGSVNNDRIRELQMVASAVEHEIKVEKALQALLTTVADGLAWRALRYDRAKIAVLGTGTQVRRLADEQALMAELHVIEEFWSRGIFAVHNDLTSCLRHGDVTAMHSDGRVEIAEVKLSERGEDPAQTRRGHDATTLINERRHVFADGEMRHILDVPVRYRTYLQTARALVPRARRVGYASATVSPVQFVAIMEHGDDAAAAKQMVAHGRAVSKVHWWRAPTRVMTFNATIRRMRDRRHSFPSLAPLSIYPFDAEDVADLMLGRLDMITALNLDGLTQQFNQAGVRVHIPHTDDDESGARFITARHEDDTRQFTIEIQPSVREQMLMELMTPANMIAQVRAMIEAVRAESSPSRVQRIPAMADEARVWTV